jgi:predicted PurR-regulated permease PerM
MPYEKAQKTLQTAGTALLNWWRAITLDALCVGLLWLIGLLALHIPLAPLWALLGGLLQFIPNFGAVLALLGPVFTVLFSGHDMYRLGLVLGLYALIMMIDGFLLQPLLLKRTARVPFWAALLGPIVLGILIPFWGILLAPPLLAIFFAFRNKSET